MVRSDLRNIAIIAHVDHGKTTLVDEMLKQGGVFRENQQVAERVMDSNDLERERGITILAKNTAVHYNDVKINIVDTPGHADFSGEVERVLKMVSGVVLLVDSFEGPMPQTRFVTKKALELSLPVIIVVNKVDRPDARCADVVDETLELLLELDATDEQLDSPVVFASGREGIASLDWRKPGLDLRPLFDTILQHIPAPAGDPDDKLQLLVSTIDYNDYIGRVGIGLVERGRLNAGQMAVRCTYHSAGVSAPTRLGGLFQFDGLRRVPSEAASVGDIVAISGFEDLAIGDTICEPGFADPLSFIKISDPTVSMNFCVNDSPFAGTEGQYVTSRHLRARLFKETQTDMSLRVEDTDTTDVFKVSGRGELHLSILIENMRRQGYEFQVTKPNVLYQEIDGERCEPIEKLICDVPSAYVGAVIEKLGRRRGTLLAMGGDDRMRLEFTIPSRGLFGYRSEFLTDTRGEGVMNAIFDGYEPYKGDIPTRIAGSLVAFETGDTTAYALFAIQERGELFVLPGTKVYSGMLVGRNARPGDIDVNVCKKKHLTSMRNSAGAEEALKITNYHIPTMEEALEFIDDDELLEITPKSFRMRKRELNAERRKKSAGKK
ncbi:translational GTPase TypA [Eubacteriales bacterium OttesenSCG-928-N13]|nr:translational GTPase TypA [Eubacteriales bacterium OttesenSCG-928-N13]